MMALNRLAFALILFFIGVSLQAEKKPQLGEGLSIKEILEIVAARNAQPAQVKLTLSGNNLVLVGSVSNYDARNEIVGVLDSKGEYTLLKIADISAVSVLDPGAAKSSLMGGRIYREEDQVVPTVLDMKRLFLELLASKPVRVDVLEETLDLDSADCRYYTEMVARDALKIVNDLVQDIEAIKQLKKFDDKLTIKSVQGSEVSTQKVDDALIVTFDCKRSLPANYTDTIRTELDRLL